MIMEMIERLLGVKEEDDEVKMETDEELPPIEVGESVLSSDKGKICMYFCWKYVVDRMCDKIPTISLLRLVVGEKSQGKV